MPRRDTRSVGELLQDADRMARELLLDVHGEDAAPLVRTWGEVVEAAADLWAAIPTHGIRSQFDPMVRLETLAQTMQSTRFKAYWPGEGPTDERAHAIAETLNRATDLVRRFGQDVPMRRPEVRADAEAARTRVMHILYVGSHGVGVAMHKYNLSVRGQVAEGARQRPLDPTRHPYMLQRTSGWIRRYEVLEQTAGDYIAGRLPEALRGEATPVPERPARFHEALAGWDIQAHRTLTASPTPSDVLLVCRTQAIIATASAVILQASTDLHPDLDNGQTDRLMLAVDRSQQAWTHLAGRWSDLVIPGSRTHQDLVQAANELRGALREVALGPSGWEPAATIAERIDLPRTSQILRDAVSAAVEVASLVDTHIQDADLVGPARVLSVRAQTDHEAAVHAGLSPDEDIVWIPPRDVHQNRLVPVPAPVRDALRTAADRAAAAADGGMTAGQVNDHATGVTDLGRAAPVDNPSGHAVLPHPGEAMRRVVPTR